MIEKTNVLPVGSMITVRFASEGGRETVAVIVGHLSLRKDRQCFYDYVCVEYPKGYENGVFYINHDDIASVVSAPDDVGNKHERWLERKYAEYKVYYSDYHPELRPDPEKARLSSRIADLMYLRNKKIHIIKRIVCAIAGIAGAASIAFVTKSWEAACGAVLFYVVGMVSEI